jgi:hypothetical protein
LRTRTSQENSLSLTPEEKWAWDFSAGEITESELLKHVERSRYWTHCALHEIALNRLANGDRVDARDYFRRAFQICIVGNDDWMLTRIFLERLEKDPTWPPWIPVKE